MRQFEVILHKQTPKVKTEVNIESQDDLQLVSDFCDYAAMQRNCAGLAANQVSSEGRLSKRFFAMKRGRGMVAIINPVIIGLSDHKAVMHEGCLTWPGKRIIAERHHIIDVRYHTLDREDKHKNLVGKWITVGMSEILTGYEAQVFQHEINHLNGVEEKFGYEGVRVGRNEPCPCGSEINGIPM